MTEEALIYSYSLRYDPKAVGSTAILKTNAAEMVVECQYPRLASGQCFCIFPHIIQARCKSVGPISVGRTFS